MSKGIILDLCGGTGSWSLPYKENGFDVRVITLPEYDVRTYKLPDEPIYGVLAAPPCDHFSGSGAQYWKQKDIDGRTDDAVSIVNACMKLIEQAKPSFWALENPVGRLYKWLGKPKMYFNPCDYGDPYTKKTCLWGNFNTPEKNPVEPIFYYYANGTKRGSWFHVKLGGKSKRTKELRAITPKGFALAFYKANSKLTSSTSKEGKEL